ncbi:GNAT family N-acetyltransferase [Aquisalinus flavus]|uniref:GNAT family acetyltransferase n=1 Tax=Aquisalinus flavus TaxID=1526572 RepID=A0A8J2V7H6_9PROT|nr:GNAT family N-acetyltransferase [Aquisalinus flavus]MBD0426447.1 GNAT family N-acetyltransferase [Aquisalinus flavus]UNE47999.1 GNAT family N-acetyltransferase [Aquisalinus flavus]GGD07830.1 GNAT family acetyltransferase [Aquisalinus flavus]
MAPDATPPDARPAPIEPRHLAGLRAINNADHDKLSWLCEGDLEALIAGAAYARQSGDGAAMMIAYREGADYVSPNYRWFAERHERFVYVDRVVVAQGARGQGHGRVFYEDLAALARAAGVPVIGCEINMLPPNPVSIAFHQTLGFVACGRAVLEPREKHVAYYRLDL